MRRRRTIYHNDARHYYLWVFDAPMNLQDAWRPIDEVAGTAVDTFSYCVERGDGIFYPSKVGLRFGADKQPFASSIIWHAWENMQSLMDQGLDPLQVLIKRAHDKGLDFFADLRLSSYGGMDPAHKVSAGGRGFAHQEVRDHHFAVLEELAKEYQVEGVELDYTAAFGESPFYFRSAEMEEGTAQMTEWVGRVAEMVRGRSGEAGEIGARVYPTEEMNRTQGLDVRTWLKEGLVDFVMPFLYTYSNLDPDLPMDWLIEAAHQADVSVYGMLQHSVRYEDTWTGDRTTTVQTYSTPETMRAAAANYWERGVDGLYTWFMPWPLGPEQRGMLTEIGDPDLIKEGNKRYVLCRRPKETAGLGYHIPLPLELDSSRPGERHAIPFYIADDIQGAPDRIRQVLLRINISNVVTQDRLTLRLNDTSLEDETCLRDFGRRDSPRGQWLEFHLEEVRPVKGQNLLEIALDHRPAGLEGSVVVEEVEIYVEYGPHPPGLYPASAK
jgi:hypothetical protein